MADEIVTQASATEPAVTPAPVTTPPAAVSNTEPSQGEHMIPKARFDEVNTELKRLKAEGEKAAKAAQAAEQAALAEQGKYKELYEKERADREAALAEMKKLHMANMRREVAAAVGLPPQLASRLIGETQEELEADAKTLLATLPAPVAPSLNGGAGGGDRRPAGHVMTEAERKELAAIYGVKPEYLPH